MSVNLLTYSNLNRFTEQILHFSSTRQGGVSSGEYASLNLGNFSDESRENIIQNRQLLCAALGIPLNRLIGAHQVHGTNVKLVDDSLLKMDENSRKASLEGFDALICNTPDVCITTTTADCVPILLLDPVTRSIAAIHSGWRSTLNNIVGCTIEALKDNFGVNPANLVAAVGPCISGAVYEVGCELEAQFHINGFDTHQFFSQKTEDKFLFNIRLAVQKQLKTAGISNIEVSPHCTFSEPDLFFSARRQGIHSGRMLSGICLKK
jgi:YfiH family protein